MRRKISKAERVYRDALMAKVNEATVWCVMHLTSDGMTVTDVGKLLPDIQKRIGTLAVECPDMFPTGMGMETYFHFKWKEEDRAGNAKSSHGPAV